MTCCKKVKHHNNQWVNTGECMLITSSEQFSLFHQHVINPSKRRPLQFSKVCTPHTRRFSFISVQFKRKYKGKKRKWSLNIWVSLIVWRMVTKYRRLWQSHEAIHHRNNRVTHENLTVPGTFGIRIIRTCNCINNCLLFSWTE